MAQSWEEVRQDIESIITLSCDTACSTSSLVLSLQKENLTAALASLSLSPIA